MLARRCVAGPETVAAPGEVEHRADAAGALAGDARHVFFAGAGAVAETVGAAGHGPLIGAVVARIGADVGRDTGADISGCGAGLAASRAGALAADTVGAEGRRAVRPRLTGLPDLRRRRRRPIDRPARIGPRLDHAHVLLVVPAGVGVHLVSSTTATAAHDRQRDDRCQNRRGDTGRVERAHPRLGETYGHWACLSD